MVNVVKENFIEKSNELIGLLPYASFVAIDEEMTGITHPNTPRPPKDDTPAARYQRLKTVPELYSIIQIGICLFTKRPDGGFDVHRYSFFLFPNKDRNVTLSAATVHFLNEHSMDFNFWTTSGVTFCPAHQARHRIQKHHRDRLQAKQPPKPASAAAAAAAASRRQIELSRHDDIHFHARAMASLREWIDSAKQQTPEEEEEDGLREGTSFLLPPCNAFLRRSLYETIGMEYPSLVLENYKKNQIQVLRMTPEEKKRRERRLEKERFETLLRDEVGFCRVFQALSMANRGVWKKNSLIMAKSYEESIQVEEQDEEEEICLKRKVPIVVHNGLMDLLFLMTHFHSSELPSEYSDAKQLVHKYFPAIYDTKILSTELARQDSTGLAALFNSVVTYEIAQVFHPVYEADQDQAHEASYDAYMTGSVFYALCRQIAANAGPDVCIFPWTEPNSALSPVFLERIWRDTYGKNRLYLMFTMYTIDMEDPSEDPFCRGMSASSTFRVGGSDPSITTRDIIRCLASLESPFPDTRLHFEIIWIDDTTFLVAARDAGSTERLSQHGELIYHALKTRFADAEIVVWKDYLDEQKRKKEEEATKKRSLWTSLMSYGSSVLGRFWGTTAEEPAPKRRRLA